MDLLFLNGGLLFPIWWTFSSNMVDLIYFNMSDFLFQCGGINLFQSGGLLYEFYSKQRGEIYLF